MEREEGREGERQRERSEVLKLMISKPPFMPVETYFLVGGYLHDKYSLKEKSLI